MAAISSIRLLVVSFSPPAISLSTPPKRRMAPQPPGPGLPLQAPSVKISTSGIDAIAGRAGDAAVKAQLFQIFDRVLGADQGTRGLVQPVIEPGQQKTQ